MKVKKCWIVVVLVALSCATAIICVAATADNPSKTSVETIKQTTYHSIGRDSLVGLEDIKVVVEVECKNSEAEKYGLTRQALQTDVELQLRRYGIRALSVNEDRQRPGDAILYLSSVIVIGEEWKFASGSINVELVQTVLLERDPTKMFFGATTWKQRGVWQVGVDNLKDVREVFKDYVDLFINDYLAANPKEPTGTKTEQKE